jgi:cell wall-associated NlpC family hydrolase
VRARALITTLSSIAIVAAIVPAAATATTNASASATSTTGGTTAAPPAIESAGGSGARKTNKKFKGRKAKTVWMTVHAPITAPTPKLEYHGPVYELVEGKIMPYVAPPPANTVLGSTGGEPVAVAAEGQPKLLVPGSTAELIEGLAAAPEEAPKPVQEMIWTANQIIGKPYVYGGGHGSFKSFGYDCSGTVSYALHGASLIKMPMDSSEMMRWGGKGVGRWVTVFANPGHAYMTIAGLRLDTSPVDDPSNQNGPRWRPLRPENAGFAMRHPVGF